MSLGLSTRALAGGFAEGRTAACSPKLHLGELHSANLWGGALFQTSAGEQCQSWSKKSCPPLPGGESAVCRVQGRWQRRGTLPVCTAGVGCSAPLPASPRQEPAGALRKQDGPAGTVMWQLWLPSSHRRNAAQGPRPDLDVFRSLFYLGKLPEAPKSPRPITPLLLLNPAPNADGHEVFFGLSHCLQRWMRFVPGKTQKNEPAFQEWQVLGGSEGSAGADPLGKGMGSGRGSFMADSE